jgi:hypothetical protein
MSNLRLSRRELLKAAGAAGALSAGLSPWVARADDDEHKKIRWDIVSISGGCVNPGGHASAFANDNSKITVTGHGTFVPSTQHCNSAVTGGGTWAITPGTATGCFTGSGTFEVTELLQWHVAAHTAFPPFNDCIGMKEDARSGLAKLAVLYSNGKRGTLTVSCQLPGSADCIFEGITASMDFEDFWRNDPPVGTPFIDANRTVFHVVEHD